MIKRLEVLLQPRILIRVSVLIIAGVFQMVAVGQVIRSSNTNLQSAEMLKGNGIRPSAAEPSLPSCPKAGPQTLQPSPLTGHHKVTLSWNASARTVNSESNAVGYCLYRSKKHHIAKQSFAKPNARCSKCEQINSRAITGTACVDDFVEDGANYYYVVTAISAKGELSSPSNEILAQVPANKQTISSASVVSYPSCRATTGPH